MSIHARFFFCARRRRHTRSIGDWSSDVCYSDLLMEFFPGALATEVFAKSLPALAASGKLGWVEFRADWCGWCKKMEKFFQESEAAPILAKYYSVVTVDTEKNEGSERL